MTQQKDNTSPTTVKSGEAGAGDAAGEGTSTNGDGKQQPPRTDPMGRTPDDPEYNPFEPDPKVAEQERAEKDQMREAVRNAATGGFLAKTDAPSAPPGDIDNHDPVAEEAAAAKAAVADAIKAADKMFDDTTDVLRHIAAWADARGSSRVGVLVTVLMRTSLTIGPRVVIPAHLGGDNVGLSLLHALVGATSGGKGRVEAVGRDCLVLRSQGRVCRFEPVSPASGEGLVKVFAEAVNNPESRLVDTNVHTPAALLSYKDAEALAALVSRSGSTLAATLLSMYMGDHLGFFTSERARRAWLPARTYVAGLSAGVHPDNGGVLLSDGMQAVGMTHRFLWTPVRDGRPKQRGTPPPALTVDLPDFGVTTDPYLGALFA